MLLCGREVRVTASIGISQGSAANGADALMGNADLAMYSIKSRGKQGHVLFEPAMHTAVLKRDRSGTRPAPGTGARGVLAPLPAAHPPVHQWPPMAWRAWRLWSAGNTRTVVCFSRTPLSFIPLAEEKGELMVALGRWVLYYICRQGKLWQRTCSCCPPRCPGQSITVNVSVRQFQQGKVQDDLAQDVDDALAHSGLDQRSLVLEITEITLMQCTQEWLRQPTELKTRGLYLTIDGFGVGYSSLAYLHRFPVDILQFDLDHNSARLVQSRRRRFLSEHDLARANPYGPACLGRICDQGPQARPVFRRLPGR